MTDTQPTRRLNDYEFSIFVTPEFRDFVNEAAMSARVPTAQFIRDALDEFVLHPGILDLATDPGNGPLKLRAKMPRSLYDSVIEQSWNQRIKRTPAVRIAIMHLAQQYEKWSN